MSGMIDEWLLFPITEEDAQLLLWIIDRRHNNQATIIASQYEPAEWLEQIPIPVAAEAITDRLSAQAYNIIIKGSRSMRLSTLKTNLVIGNPKKSYERTNFRSPNLT